MQRHIYVHTPIHNLSDYLPHLIEHCVLWGIRNGAEYFNSLKYSAESYTYYTCFTVDSFSNSEVVEFCNRIRVELPRNRVKYEAWILRKELMYPNRHQSIISKVWKCFYGKWFRYSESGRLNYAEVADYHDSFYRQANFILLDSNNKHDDLQPSNSIHSIKLEVVIEKENFLVLADKHSAESYFINEVLQGLFDSYMEFQMRHVQGEYFTDDTLAGDFEEYTFLAIPKRHIGLIASISDSFIASYIPYALEHLANKENPNIDGPLLIKYWFCLTRESKNKIINDTFSHYQKFQFSIKNSL